MIAYLSYVRCDRCGNPAQPAEAGQARLVARREGFKRINRQDLCRSCQPVVPEEPQP